MSSRILVVDDDSLVREFVSETLKRRGYFVDEAESGETAIEMLAESDYELVITDLKMHRVSGMDVLRETMKIQPECRVMVITAFGTIENAVEAMRIGACDYITKPFTADELEILVERSLEYKKLRDENRSLRNELDDKYAYTNLVGNSPAMKKMFELIKNVANSPSTVLVTGETGTGKELVARAIHYNSNRANKPFIKMNCAALPEGLIESELFGHEKGAFTGAIKANKGKFEQAIGGTLLLDEISEIPPRIQAKLLRVIQEREIERLGSSQTIPVDVRLVATSNRDLKTMVAKGRFRDDLYFRLQVIPINLPPLRERLDDIPLLCEHFIAKYCRREGVPIKTLSEKVIQMFMGYNWPGNIRELENYIERAVVISNSEELKPSDFPIDLKTGNLAHSVDRIEVGLTIADMEKRLILKTLEANNWNKERTADILGITSRTLRNKLAEYKQEEGE
ncbi:MAG: sigma-54-dependent Fis family transcriptional regulator [candidate division Zixibacteria bacterium]|jgi:DNA-binding NtrC family response regulator|nr:sigma-54-dependent Fis family transcriptional regulator [candidate division Zixibacteria bacterium]